MIRPDMIPPEAVEAAARAIEQSLKTARITLESEDGYKPEARAAILAALEAWPDAYDGVSAGVTYRSLPLNTQENENG